MQTRQVRGLGGLHPDFHAGSSGSRGGVPSMPPLRMFPIACS